MINYKFILLLVIVIVLVLIKMYYKKIIINFISSKQYNEKNVKSTIKNFNIFGNITNINKNNFDKEIIEINSTIKNQYKIIDLKDYLNNEITNKENITNMLKKIIPHIKLNNESVNLEDCTVIDILDNKGGYFPKIHTDIEWKLTPHNGFNVWFLVNKHDNNDNKGNMFVFDTFYKHDNNTINIYINKNKEIIHEQIFPQSKNKKIINPKDISVKYLDMNPGECLIMNSNIPHTSDFRLKENNNRRAINFRVIVNKKDNYIFNIYQNKAINLYNCIIKNNYSNLLNINQYKWYLYFYKFKTYIYDKFYYKFNQLNFMD